MKKHIFSLSQFCWLCLSVTLSWFIAAPEIHSAQESKIMTNNLALMPFFIGKKPSETQSVLDLKPEQLRALEEVLPGADKTLTQLVQYALDKRFGNGILTQEEVQKTCSMILAEEPDLTPRKLVLKLGQQLGVDYVVAGNVWCYTARSGNALASDKPASVAFKLHLIHIPSQKRIWAEVYDKTQQPLSQNLFKAPDFIKQKGQWLTAEDLAEIGVNDLVKRMPL